MRRSLRQAGALVGVLIIGVCLSIPSVASRHIYAAETCPVLPARAIGVEHISDAAQLFVAPVAVIPNFGRCDCITSDGNFGLQGVAAHFAGLEELIAAGVGFHGVAGPKGSLREADMPADFQKVGLSVSRINVSEANAQLGGPIRPLTHFGRLEADRLDVGLVASEESQAVYVVLTPNDVGLASGNRGLLPSNGGHSASNFILPFSCLPQLFGRLSEREGEPSYQSRGEESERPLLFVDGPAYADDVEPQPQRGAPVDGWIGVKIAVGFLVLVCVDAIVKRL